MKKVFVLALAVLVMSASAAHAQYKGKYVGWSTGYCAFSGKLVPQDYRAFTHLVNFVALVTSTQTIDTTSLLFMKSSAFVDSCRRHGVKALLGIGSAGTGVFFAAACSSASKQTLLVNNIVSLIRQYNYDGVDIDWEDGPIILNNYVGFFKQVRDSINAMVPVRILTAPIAFSVTPSLAVIFPYVDQMNYMTYWDPVTNLNPYFATARGLGVPKSKLGVGFGWGTDNEVTGPDDILAKCRYAIDSGLGGINAWDIGKASGVTLWILDSISRFVRPGVPPPIMPSLVGPYNNLTDLPLNPTLSWNPVLGATAYLVQVCLNGDFSTQPIINSVVSLTTLEAGPLSPKTDYWWRVKALNNLSESGWSSVWTFTTAPATSILPARDHVFLDGMNASSSCVRFSVSKASRVVVRLYSVSGALLETVCNSLYAPGLYRISLKSSRLAPGNYLLDFRAGTFGGARKMIVLQ